ncbi:hypothetical protein LJC33_00480 [Eubacteriales bacterium OttesenSCG-928-N13]|nr:hypothetical protein [Eubacteriales bacterium OttesenSCG-928-N13]
MNYKLGRVGIVVHDAFIAGTDYEALDMVPYEGGLYIAKGTTDGSLPTDTECWVQVVPPTVAKDYVDEKDNALGERITTLNQDMEDGLATTKTYVDTQDAALGERVADVEDALATTKTYVDTQDAALSGRINALNQAMDNGLATTKTYVDTQDAALAAQIASLNQAVQNGLAFDSKTITLPTTSSWSSYQYNIAVPGVTPTSTVWVSPDANSFINYSQYRIRCIAQGNGTLTFRYENSPTVATVVNVVIAN